MPETNTNNLSTLVVSDGSLTLMDAETLHPTSEQYNAMRSGITSTDVSQISTNASDIALVISTLEGVL